LAKLSEYFEGWSDLSNITPTTNYTTSPEGLQNATRLQFTSNGYIYNSGAPTQVSGTEYTLTLYAKRNDSGTQSFGFFTNGSGSVDSAMALTSEWQRFTYTYTASNNSQLGLAGLSGADVSVYGFQVEQGSYPTSYIPNHSGGSVTRDADASSLTGVSSLIGQTEGTIFCEINIDELDYNVDILAINNSTNSEYIAIFKYSSNVMRSRVRANSINNTIDHSITATGTYKVALKYNRDTFALFINGVKINEISATITFTSTIERIFVGPSLYVGLGKAKYRQLLTLTEALPDNQCIMLTS
jgi:hypothetical protein